MSALRSIDLVVQALPPTHDAIGEYTAFLACELGKGLDVRVLTNCDHPIDTLDGVRIDPCFSLQGKRRFFGLLQSLKKTNANAVVLQYNPFAWGNRGWAPDLVRVIRDFKIRRPDVTIAVMFHETYMMNPGFRSWLMRQYQRRQFQSLCSAAHICFFSTELWAREYRERDPQALAFHLPVGANLPVSAADGKETRRRWRIDENDFVCGVFGGAHPSRMLPWIERAVVQIDQQRNSERRVVFFHVGGEPIQWSIPNVPVITTGRLSADEASDAIAIMDLLINPFSDGISTRRGSAMAALQNGVPLLTTRGHATDSVWDQQSDKSVFLSSANSEDNWQQATQKAWKKIKTRDPIRQEKIKQFYRANFSWPVIGKALCGHLSDVINV